ncbi:MAG: hypothetical protein AB7N80_12185 [Bdellovibrionales bacterium]
MRIVKADLSDNDRLCEFFNQTILPGHVDLRLEREDFFLPYRLQSDDHATYLLLNQEEQVEAMATLVFRPGYLGGQRQTIGYATDLRVSNSRRAILSWAEHFLPVLEAEKSARQCNSVFTVVAQLQRQAYNAFIRPRLTRRPLPRYHLFRSFRMVSVHGIMPWAAKPLSTIFLRQGTDSDLEMIASYLAGRHRRGVLHFTSDIEEVLQSLKRWPGLRPSDFILALDFHRRLVGCVAPWDSDHLQKTFAVNYHRRAKVLYDSLQALALFRLGKRLPKAGRAVHFSYLTHFCADNPDIFYSLLHAGFRTSPNQFVIYPHFEGDLPFTPPRGMITASLRAGLYCIQDPNQLSPDFLNWSRRATPPEFELPFL